METENVESKKPEVKHEVKHEHDAKHETKHEAHHAEHHEAHKKSVSDDAKDGKSKIQFWPALSAVLAILLLISVFSGATVSSSAPGAKSLDKQQFAADMETFIQESLTQNAAAVTIENITEEGGLYKFSVLLDGKLAAISYATKDGALLFPSGGLNVEQYKEQAKLNANGANQQKAPQASTVAKSDKPIVQLFVMSQCPYGVQAENAIKPVLDALKGKISFELRFIANSDGNGGFTSLHGQAEVDEDLRQVCAAKYAPAAYMDYVVCRNKNIRSTDWQACATEAKIDSAKIKTCSEGAEGNALLTENIKLAEELGVGGSPTIKINSGAYNGQRTAEAFQSGICAAFNTAPAECGTAVASSASAAEVPAGGCGA